MDLLKADLDKNAVLDMSALIENFQDSSNREEILHIIPRGRREEVHAVLESWKQSNEDDFQYMKEVILGLDDSVTYGNFHSGRAKLC